MSMTNYLENKILNHIANKEVYTAPDKCYMALLTSSSTDEAIGEEVVASDYSRKPIVFETSTDGILTNATDVVFEIATESWGTLTSVAIYDAETDGNPLFYTDLAVPQEVLQDNQIIFKTGKLTIALD